MQERALAERQPHPEETRLNEILGKSYPYYLALLNQTKDFQNKWTYYKGWSLKVFDRKKSLFYLAPHKDAFQINMAIRTHERDMILKDNELSVFHKELESGEVYQEGIKVSRMIEDDISFSELSHLLKEIADMR